MHKIVLGIQWGDEGKGKLVDLLAEDVKYIVRSQGGNNAGHTVVVGAEKFKFNLLPAGILHKDKICIIGNGVVVNPEILLSEMSSLESRIKEHAELYISDKAHLIMPWHIKLDELTGKGIGTTGRGIGPAYADKISRRGIRFVDLINEQLFAERVGVELEENNWLLVNKYKSEPLNKNDILNKYLDYAQKLRYHVAQTESILSKAVDNDEQILFEGAQGSMLDIDFGTYPYVTSSNTTLGGNISGSGVRARNVEVIGVAKAYTTRVGNGPFPTELKDKTGDYLRSKGSEFGTTTGRPRRCGWIDTIVIKYSSKISGVDSLVITKLDILSGLDELFICTAYKLKDKQLYSLPTSSYDLENCVPVYEKLAGWNEDLSEAKRFEHLPENARKYIQKIEELAGLPVKYIGVGVRRDQLIKR